MLNYKKPAFWIVTVAVVACIAVSVYFLTNPVLYAKEIQVGGIIYTHTGKTVSNLPEGSTELGTLEGVRHRTKEHPTEDFCATNLHKKYSGNMIYQSGTDMNIILLEDHNGFYLRFVCEDADSPVTSPEPTQLAYEAVYSWVNYSEEGGQKMLDRSLDKDSMEASSVMHLPIVRLENKGELDAFYGEMQPYFSFDQDYDESVAFQTQCARYDDTFFKTNTLFVTYISEFSGSNRHSIEGVWTENGSVSVGVNRIVPEMGDTAMAGWFIAVAVDKEDISDCTGFDAYVYREIDPNAAFPDGPPILTMEDVISLSQKGEDLTWSDFDQYAYSETGSGLYIRVYEINDQYSLWIGGGSTTGEPIYIYLTTDTDERIDMRRKCFSFCQCWTHDTRGWLLKSRYFCQSVLKTMK